MANYAIGDIQGCYDEFMQLIDKIAFNKSTDTLYLVGDLINRGPQSLKVLEWIYQNQDSIITVLGNHDFYLLGRYSQVITADSDETIKDIINNKNASKLIDYLRQSPLVYQDDKIIMAHAGVHPVLNLNKLMELNKYTMEYLQGNNYPYFISLMFGNKPTLWSDRLDLDKQIKFAINSCTRMRFLNKHDLSLDYKFKGEISNLTENLLPWFNAPFNESINKKIIFGHWAALGLYQDDRVVALDTGCVWGRYLTALNIDTNEIIQVKSNVRK